MTRLTLFTIPKPFDGHIGLIQRNAIRSWCALGQSCEVILFGNEKGIPEIAREFKLRHVSDIAINDYGTPLVSDVFAKAQELASHDLLCYVNADIVLMKNFLDAIQRVGFFEFLIIGRRWDLDVKEPLDFADGWESSLLNRLRCEGRLHESTGIDYFVFPRGLYQHIPPFAVGRPVWDNWMIYKARLQDIPVIDASEAITIVHQNHGYADTVISQQGHWKGPETEKNLELAGDLEHCFTLMDANWMLTVHGLERQRPTLARMCREFETFAALNENHPSLYWLTRPIVAGRIGLRRMARKMRQLRSAASTLTPPAP